MTIYKNIICSIVILKRFNYKRLNFKYQNGRRLNEEEFIKNFVSSLYSGILS